MLYIIGKCKSPDEWFEEKKEYDENLVVANDIEKQLYDYFKQRHQFPNEDDLPHSTVAQWIHSYGLKLAEMILGPVNCELHLSFRDIFGKNRLESFEIIGDALFQSLHWVS